jgi:hypothetical protein
MDVQRTAEAEADAGNHVSLSYHSFQREGHQVHLFTFVTYRPMLPISLPQCPTKLLGNRLSSCKIENMAHTKSVLNVSKLSVMFIVSFEHAQCVPKSAVKISTSVSPCK